ncbi:MAG: hypothetical protein ACP5T3_02810 [Candidatus Micrarchaeia archaeon]
MTSTKTAAQRRSGRMAAFARILTKPAYAAVALAAATLYYLLFYFLIKGSTDVFFITLPMYLIYALVATGALAFTIGMAGAVHAYKRRRASASSGIACSVTSTITPLIGGVVASCGCESPVVFPFIIGLGFSSLQALAFVSLLAKYNTYIVLAMIAINLFLIYYQLGKEKAIS